MEFAAPAGALPAAGSSCLAGCLAAFEACGCRRAAAAPLPPLAAADVGGTLDLLEVILASVPVAALGRAACVSSVWRAAAAPALAQLAAGTWHPAYLARWWGRAAV